MAYIICTIILFRKSLDGLYIAEKEIFPTTKYFRSF